jgi:hypothetical protein
MKRHRCERVGRRGSDVLKSGFDGFCTDSGSLFATDAKRCRRAVHSIYAVDAILNRPIAGDVR